MIASLPLSLTDSFIILEIVPRLCTNNWSNDLASTVVILKFTLTGPPPVPLALCVICPV
jgi:hypothetical protein